MDRRHEGCASLHEQPEEVDRPAERAGLAVTIEEESKGRDEVVIQIRIGRRSRDSEEGRE